MDKPRPQNYRNSSIKDLVSVANEKNIDCLLADLKNYIIIASTQDQNPIVLGDNSSELCQYSIRVNPDHFDWVDDGNNDLIFKYAGGFNFASKDEEYPLSNEMRFPTK